MRRIVILGMGRSGTTFVTEFLGKCGVYLDEVNWAYEHELARMINDTVLEREFGARAGLPYGKLPKHEIQLSAYWGSMASFYVKYMDARAQIKGNVAAWAFKDPRTTVLHNIWMDHFDTVIGVFRAPQEVTASYVGKGWIAGFRKQSVALDYWKRFNRSLLSVHAACEGKKPVYILDYNRDMESQTRLLCERLDIPVSDEAQLLFSQALNHYPSETLPEDSEAVLLYRRLQSIALVKQ
jgi:hypothetical protein